MQELDAFYNQLIHLSLFGIKVKIIIPRNKIAKLEEFLAENGKKFIADDDMAIQAQNTGQKSFNSPIDFE